MWGLAKGLYTVSLAPIVGSTYKKVQKQKQKKMGILKGARN